MAEYTLYLGDCLEEMKLIPDGSVDVLITDPPYGIGINGNTNGFGVAVEKSRKATNKTWDNKIPDARYFKEMFRISKNQIIFGANYFWNEFYPSSCYIVWDKRFNLPDVPFSPTEFAWTSYDGKTPKKYTIVNHGFIRWYNDLKTGHPTQKPVKLMREIILDFTRPGDVICDPFMGSGTTGVACMRTGRNFIGIELDPGYFKIAQTRIKNANNEFVQTDAEKAGGQLSLFDAR